MTINPYLVVLQYPVPRMQDLLSELKGGQKFTKLDLSHAYQQVVLVNESRDYVATNTHIGPHVSVHSITLWSIFRVSHM